MPRDQERIRRAAERGLLISTLGEETYGRLHRRYGHEKVWKGFSGAIYVFSKKGLRFMFHMFVRRWRIRFERLQRWLEDAN